MTLLDPVKIVDRDPESRRFEDLLVFNTPKRVLTVSDSPGRGKTTLLQKLRWICEFRHELPVVLVPLEEYDDHPDEFELVHDIVRQLKEADVRFPAFEKLAAARSFHDNQAFLETYRSVQGVVHAGGATVQGDATVAGVIYNIEHADQVGLAAWSDRADEEAKRLCLDAFFGELAAAARERPIVFLFDTVDAATDQLQRWIYLQLVRRRVLADAGQDQRLLVVLAGMDIDAKLRGLFEGLYDSCFDVIPALGDWEFDDSGRLLEVHGYAGLPPEVVTMLHQGILSRQLSLAGALGVAAIYKTSGGQ